MLHACAAKFDATMNLEKFWELNKALVPKTTKNFKDSPSHRILQQMHEILNIDKNKN